MEDELQALREKAKELQAENEALKLRLTEEAQCATFLASPAGRAFVRRVGELQAIEEVVKPFLDGTVRSADLAAWLRARLASGST